MGIYTLIAIPGIVGQLMGVYRFMHEKAENKHDVHINTFIHLF